MKIILILAASMLAGCGTTTTFVPAGEPKIVKAGANVMTACDAVPPAPARGTNFGDLLVFSDQMIGLYDECAARDSAKADFIKSQGH